METICPKIWATSLPKNAQSPLLVDMNPLKHFCWSSLLSVWGRGGEDPNWNIPFKTFFVQPSVGSPIHNPYNLTSCQIISMIIQSKHPSCVTIKLFPLYSSFTFELSYILGMKRVNMLPRRTWIFCKFFFDIQPKLLTSVLPNTIAAQNNLVPYLTHKTTTAQGNRVQPFQHVKTQLQR